MATCCHFKCVIHCMSREVQRPRHAAPKGRGGHSAGSGRARGLGSARRRDHCWESDSVDGPRVMYITPAGRLRTHGRLKGAAGDHGHQSGAAWREGEGAARRGKGPKAFKPNASHQVCCCMNRGPPGQAPRRWRLVGSSEDWEGNVSPSGAKCPEELRAGPGLRASQPYSSPGRNRSAPRTPWSAPRPQEGRSTVTPRMSLRHVLPRVRSQSQGRTWDSVYRRRPEQAGRGRRTGSGCSRGAGLLLADEGM